MPATTATTTPPDTPSIEPRVLGPHQDAGAEGSGEREALIVPVKGKGKGYRAIPIHDEEEEHESEQDDVEASKAVNRVSTRSTAVVGVKPGSFAHTDPVSVADPHHTTLIHPLSRSPHSHSAMSHHSRAAGTWRGVRLDGTVGRAAVTREGYGIGGDVDCRGGGLDRTCGDHLCELIGRGEGDDERRIPRAKREHHG